MASSGVAERLPAMCGSETLTTVVSSTSMKVLVITAIATSQGFTSFHAPAELRSKVWVAVAITDESYEMLGDGEWTRIAGEPDYRNAPGLFVSFRTEAHARFSREQE